MMLMSTVDHSTPVKLTMPSKMLHVPLDGGEIDPSNLRAKAARGKAWVRSSGSIWIRDIAAYQRSKSATGICLISGHVSDAATPPARSAAR